MPNITTNQMPAASAAATTEREQKLWRSCCDLEGVFLSTLLKEMRKTVPSEGGVLPESQGRRMFREMLDEQLSEVMSARGVSGLAARLYQQFDRPQAVEPSEAGNSAVTSTVNATG